MVNLFAAPDALQNPRLLVRAVRRYQNHDGLADDLFGRIPEQLLRAFVPTPDDAVQILADDGVVRRFDDSRQMADGLFRPLAFGNVGERIEGMRARVDLDYRRSDHADPLLPTPGADASFNSVDALALSKELQRLVAPLRLDPQPQLFRRATQRLFAGVTRQPHKAFVDFHQSPVVERSD